MVLRIFDLDYRLKSAFHMAFDSITEEKKNETIDKLISLEFDRILTKGCNTKALDGLENLKSYFKYADERIVIMPGGGVTKENYINIAEQTGCKEFHGTKIVGKID